MLFRLDFLLTFLIKQKGKNQVVIYCVFIEEIFIENLFFHPFLALL
jgi:hypothetical protein